MTLPKLLTVQEAANYLRVTDQTIIRYIKAGDLEARKVGRQWRVEETKLHSFTAPPAPIEGKATE